MGGKGNVFVGKRAFATATPRLIFICLVYSLGSIFFGYDSASFGGVQAFKPFVRKFGPAGAAKLPAKTASIMNSMPLIGKFLGTVFIGPMIERFGHRWAMSATCLVQIVGVVIQTTSTTVAQFTVGRLLIYLAVGLVENVVPTYQSEISPGPLRGFFVGSIQLCLTFGALIAGIVNEFMSRKATDVGWVVATALQAAPAVLILSLLYFTPNSPRWLVSKDRTEDALKVLHNVRTKSDVDRGLCELEVQAMIEDSQTTMRKAPWKDLFKDGNRRRTGIACSIMAFQQLTGVTFSSSYGPTFYKSVGLSEMAFAYAAINNGVSVVTALIAMIALDRFGRRDLTLHGCWTQAAFLIVIGTVGAKSAASRSSSDTYGMVASFILYAGILHMTLGPSAYVTAAEVGTASLREKTMAISTAFNVVVGFVVVFTTPYLLDAIGARLGYVWAGFALLGSVWTWFCMPELKGRTLEEIDQLFDARLPARKFGAFETTGLSHALAELEQGGKTMSKVHVEEVEDESQQR